MSGFKKKLKEKAGRLADWLPSGAPSPVPSDQNPNSPVPAAGSHTSIDSARTSKKKAGLLVDRFLSSSRVPSPSPAPPDPDPAPPAPSANRNTYADPQNPPTVRAMVSSVVHELLVAARDGSDLCLPLKAALVGVIAIWDVCERTAKVKDEYEKLESRLTHLHAVTQAYGKRNHFDANLKLRLCNIASSFEQLATCVAQKLERGTVRRVLESQGDVDEVKNILQKISARIESFIYESMIRVEIGMSAILAQLPSAEEKEMEKELVRWRETVQVIASTLGSRRVHEAAHDTQPSDAGCMPGTRVGVLKKFVTWIKTDPKGILWLAGLAGTGKTSVAVTLCHMLERDPDVLLGGTFFCSRTTSVEVRTDVRRILPTLAVQLANQSPRFATELAAELKPDSGAAAHKPAKDQLGPLLQRPLAALAKDKRPIVFVIDALDECSDERELAGMLVAIAQFNCNANVKFILTSRPETHILGSPISDRHQNEILQLHMIDTAEATEDIRLYIDNTFSRSPLAQTWYSDVDVTALATLSNGLFIFASTVISYILDTESMHGRTTRLAAALEAVSHSAVAMGPLDAMYEFILTRASDAAKVEPKELEVTQRVIACILAARVSLSVNTLAELLGLEADFLRESLRRLHAAVHVPSEDDEPGLRTLHASFGDYLFDRAASHIRVQTSLGDETLAGGCLHIMRTRLHFNISQCRSSYEPNPSTKPDSIALALEYSCFHWIYHIANLPETSSFDTEIDDVFRPRFLFWLEVMSVLKHIQRAVAVLMIAAVTVRSAALSQYMRDANTFVAASRGAIELSAPHIYISALPFAAKDSLVFKTFAPMCTGLIFVDTHGTDRHGGRLIMTLTGHERKVRPVVYSPDGNLLSTGSEDGTLRVWDTRTGEETMSPLRSGDGSVCSAVFSPNGKIIASGTAGGVVCLWSVTAVPSTARRLCGHTGSVWSVAFSSDGSVLASASEDKTIIIWSVQTAQSISVLNDHAEEVNAVAFSPDGRILASGYQDQTIRLWLVATGELAGLPLVGHKGSVLGVCFSPDGKKIASCSEDESIIIWEAKTGENIATLRGHSNWVRSVQFSPNGLSLVSAGYDRTIRHWNLFEDVAKASSLVLEGHLGYVYSATFSPDGMYIASGSADCTVRIWEAGSGQPAVQPLKMHNEAVNSVAVSLDGSFIVSGSYDKSIRAWDSNSGEPKLPPLLGHAEAVLSVTISSDGRLIASGSADCTIRLWDACTGEVVGEALHGHEDKVNAVAFSPSDALSLASGSGDATVRVWNVSTGEPFTIWPLICVGAVTTVVFSLDGRLLAAGDMSGFIYQWRAETGQRVREIFYTGGQISSVAFSPAGTQIVSSGSGSVVCIWDAITGQSVLALDCGGSWVVPAAFSFDGRLIGTGSSDNSVRLWDSATGSLIATLLGHQDWVQSVVFTPDGRSIVSSADDWTIRFWDIETARSLPTKSGNDLFRVLAPASFTDGWLWGKSGELLLWVPAEYRSYLHVGRCTLLIAQYHVVITADPEGLHRGDNWTACWRNLAPPAPLLHAM